MLVRGCAIFIETFRFVCKVIVETKDIRWFDRIKCNMDSRVAEVGLDPVLSVGMLT